MRRHQYPIARAVTQTDVATPESATARLVELRLNRLDLPFDVRLRGVGATEAGVAVVFEMPPLEVVPGVRFLHRQDDSIWTRPIAKADRGQMYKDLCLQLGIRLIWEAFEASPSVNEVRLYGVLADTDAAGAVGLAVAMHASVRRGEFKNAMTSREPVGVASAIGLELRCNRDGGLRGLANCELPARTLPRLNPFGVVEEPSIPPAPLLRDAKDSRNRIVAILVGIALIATAARLGWVAASPVEPSPPRAVERDAHGLDPLP